jgi:dihydropteroate synthase
VVDVMGVLNVTPDSFSDGGEHLRVDAALARAAEMVAQGAVVIDVGGESTRPGATPVDPVEEQRRVLPVIEALADRLAGPDPIRPDDTTPTSTPPMTGTSAVRLSIDTRHAATARAAIAAGATLVNDVSASLWQVAADTGAGWVAMHMFGDPRTMQSEPYYDDVVDDVRSFLVERARTAVAAGVGEVWIDPGIGFGKTTRHNLALLAHLDVLVAEGFPVLVGTSRKRFLGELIARSDQGLAPFDARHRSDPQPPVGPPADLGDRVDGSLATAMWAMIHGAGMVRVHDVDVTVQGAAVAFGSIPAR